MRRHALLFVFCAFFPAGCGPDNPSEKPASDVAGEHNARNSLDYAGSYNYNPAVKDNEAKNIALMGVDRFRIITGNGTMKVGRFVWDKTGNKVVLNGRDVEDVVLSVEENRLVIMNDGPEKGRVFQKYQ